MNRSIAACVSLRCGRCGVFIRQSATSIVMMVLPRERREVRRRHHAADVVGMVMRQHDQPRGVERALELDELLREVGLRLVRAEAVVRRLVEPGIEHHGAVGIDHLERGARHGDRRIVAARDHELLRPDRGRDPHAVDGERQARRAAPWPCARITARSTSNGFSFTCGRCSGAPLLVALLTYRSPLARSPSPTRGEGTPPRARHDALPEMPTPPPPCAPPTPRAFTTTLMASSTRSLA